MLARGLLCRLAAHAPKTSTHDLPQLANLLQRNAHSGNALSLPAMRALSRAYATKTAATKPTATVKKAVKKAAAKKPAPKKSATRKTTAKKPRKKTVAKKKKAKPKKALTAEEKRKALIQQLKLRALRDPVTPRRISGYAAFMSENLSGNAHPEQSMKDMAAKYRNLTPAEKEHYNHIASEKSAAKEKQFEAWVQSYTPDQIRVANLARGRLRKLLPKLKSKASHAHTLPIADSRRPKPSLSPYTRFLVERHSSGDLKGISITDASKLILNEWKVLSASEKKKFEDAAAVDRERYHREYEQTYGHKTPRSKSES